jgi:L-fuconolactonase
MTHFRIDAHQHVWDPTRSSYLWMTPDSALHRPAEFPEILSSLQYAGMGATVLVQADDTDEDTAFMLETAQTHPEIVGVVAWAPLDDTHAFARRLEEFVPNHRVVGIRSLIHEQPDPEWLLKPQVLDSLALLEQAGLTLDVPAEHPRHLEQVITLGERFSDLPIVVDHLGKPPIGQDDAEPWFSLLGAVAENPRVNAKVSGLYGAKGAESSWTLEGIRPWFDRAVETFGPERLMYGGDWPVCELAGGYDRMWNTLAMLIDGLSDEKRDRVLGGTAESFYGLDSELLRIAKSATAHP